MKITQIAAQTSQVTDMRQNEAVFRTRQMAVRAKIEAQQASGDARSRSSETSQKVARKASSLELSRFQAQTDAARQASAKVNGIVAQRTRDVTSVLATLISPPIRGAQTPDAIGRFIDKFA
ncbi:MAG TPA: hypothetical protein PLP29_15100 [Candidatus Ozemobacteraceae bacterium]|nr:hypothetical protein [Candidatus Ozemobacteraceae bacterium]